MPKPDPVRQDNFLLSLGESLRRQAGSPNINSYIPHAKQVDFHSSPAKTRLYIGGNRSGKSFGSIAECVFWLRKDHPYRRIPVPDWEPCRGRINTVDYINGWEKIIQPLLKQLMPPSLLINGSWEDSYHKQEHVLNCSNGSMLEILSYESDLDKFAGTSRHFISYDEEPPEAIYTENKARLIDTGGHQWFAMTPVEGMSWVYDAIFLPGEEGKPGFHNTTVSMEENPHLNMAEVQEFLDGLDEEERKARGQGIFVEFGGRIYKSFDPHPGGIHVVDKENLRMPRNIPIGVSLDHGYNNPTAVYWHAILPEGRILTYHEHYLSGATVREHAAIIHKFNRAHRIEPTIWVADPSIRNTDPITGTSIHQEYLKYGIPWMLGNNDVKAGIERVNSYIKPRGAAKRPMWSVTKDCVNMRREMARYKWKTYTSKKLNAEYNKMEEPHKKDDHSCDSLRYFLMSRPDLGSIFTEETQGRAEALKNWEGAVRSTDGDFTVTTLRAGEYEALASGGRDYAHREGDDMLGGLW